MSLLMKHTMKQPLSVITILIMVSTVSAGCLENGLFGNDKDNLSLASPTWEKGDFWEYAITVDDKQFSTTMVFSVDDEFVDLWLCDVLRFAVHIPNPVHLVLPLLLQESLKRRRLILIIDQNSDRNVLSLETLAELE